MKVNKIQLYEDLPVIIPDAKTALIWTAQGLKVVRIGELNRER